MQTVDEMIADIICREGKYNDRASDRGGATNLGVSLRYAKGIGLDLDGDGDTDKDDIRLVTPDVAAELYREDFFKEPRIDRLPASVHPILFDCAVNHGPPRAIMFLQNVINEAGFGPTQVDGVVGPQTRSAAEAAAAAMGPFLVNAIVEERLTFYDAIIANDPSQAEYERGWKRRANEFRIEV